MEQLEKQISLPMSKRVEYSRSIPLQIEAARAAEREAAAARAAASQGAGLLMRRLIHRMLCVHVPRTPNPGTRGGERPELFDSHAIKIKALDAWQRRGARRLSVAGSGYAPAHHTPPAAWCACFPAHTVTVKTSSALLPLL